MTDTNHIDYLNAYLTLIVCAVAAWLIARSLVRGSHWEARHKLRELAGIAWSGGAELPADAPAIDHGLRALVLEYQRKVSTTNGHG
jgi:hypothetical protein